MGTPHFLRVARALTLVGSAALPVAVVACGSTDDTSGGPASGGVQAYDAGRDAPPGRDSGIQIYEAGGGVQPYPDAGSDAASDAPVDAGPTDAGGG